MCRERLKLASHKYHNKSVQFAYDKSRQKPCPKRQILDPFKLIAFSDDNFKFDENGGNFSKRLENTVGKRGSARYEQFLVFPQCFQKICLGKG